MTHDVLVIGIAGWMLGVLLLKHSHYVLNSGFGLVFVTASYRCLSLRLGQVFLGLCFRFQDKFTFLFSFQEPVGWLLQLAIQRQPMVVAMWGAVLLPSLVWYSSRQKTFLVDRWRLLLHRKGFHALAFVLFVPVCICAPIFLYLTFYFAGPVVGCRVFRFCGCCGGSTAAFF
jgi:hypothetical protein